MSDLISRQAAIEAIAALMPKSITPDGSHPADEEIFRIQEIYADCIEAIEILPTQPGIVRCKDCRYSERSGYWCALHNTEMEPEAFCNYGEEREE